MWKSAESTVNTNQDKNKNRERVRIAHLPDKPEKEYLKRIDSK